MESGTEEHPFRWYVPENARSLIIGTFPPIRKRWSYDFFYPNRKNLFWKILSDIAGIRLTDDLSTAVEQRKKILDKLGLAISDMGGAIKRNAGNSLDENLELVAYMPILDILNQHTGISRIILTSSSGRSSALGWFRSYLKENNIACNVPKGIKPLHFSIEYRLKTYEVYILYSPSPRASNRISYEAMVDMYRKVIK